MPARIDLNRPDTRSKVRKDNGRVRDPAYRRSAQGRMCDVPGCEDTETVVLAHIRLAGNCGTGLKPPDDESLFLCRHHHDEMDRRVGGTSLAADYMGGAMWIVRNIVIPFRKENYRLWKSAGTK